jgi:MYXO-CTERM domain-containing protein
MFPIVASLLGPGFGFSNQTAADGIAWLTIHPDASASGVEIELTGDDGFRMTKTISLRKGKETKIKWKQKGKTVAYDLAVLVGDEQTDFSFEVQKPLIGGKYGPIKLISDVREILYGRMARYESPFLLTQQEFKVYNTDGELIAEQDTNDVIEPGTTIERKWTSTDEVFTVSFTGTDDAGRQQGYMAVPWKLEVPHVDVVFESGKWDILDSEKKKLDDAYAIMAYELAKLDNATKAVPGADLKAQLYIVGHTDTVGNAGDNKKLSQNRGAEIAKYFVNKGIWCEVWAAGMGERGLAVKTDDSVDEVRNRRAQYIVAMQKPAPRSDIPSPNAWGKVSDASVRMAQKLPEVPQEYLDWKRNERLKNMGVTEEDDGGSGGSGGSSGSGSAGGSGGSSSDSGSGDGGTDFGSSAGDGASSDDAGSNGDGEAPPAAEPGKKGCAVDVDAGPFSALWLVGAFGIAARRRREV